MLPKLHPIVPVVLVSNEEYWLPFVLKSIMHRFPRYVIYDIGSVDSTKKIIDWFIQEQEGKSELFIRYLPMVPRQVQGAFRNSMIAEACAEHYLIVDGDEIWPAGTDFNLMAKTLYAKEQLYGVTKRKEMNFDLTHAYSDLRTHHRLYNRSAFWLGNHPGEEPGIDQKPKNEVHFDEVVYHFHNTVRSSTEDQALKRMERKSQKTYHPGELKPFNLLDELPILKTRVENFPVSPVLEKLWDKQ